MPTDALSIYNYEVVWQVSFYHTEKKFARDEKKILKKFPRGGAGA